jgi:hypothetical protein
VQHQVEPLIAMRCQQHHLPLEQRFAADAKPPALDADSMIWMAWMLSTQQERALCAAQEHGGAEHRHHQAGDALSSVPAAGAGKGQRGVEPGGAGLQPAAAVQAQTHAGGCL